MAAQFDAMAELQKTFQTLFQKNNWLLAVPILVGSIIAGVVVVIGVFVAFGSMIFGGGMAAVLSGGGEGGRGGAGLFGLMFSGLGLLFLLCVLIAIVIGVFGYGWAYAAAAPIWKGGAVDLGGGFSKAMSKLGNLALLAIIVGVVSGLLGWTIIVPLAVFFFCMFTIPYVMDGNQSGTGAIGASINLVKNNFGPTGMLFLAFIVLGIAAGIINAVLGIIPLIGSLIGIVVGSVLGSYAVLAIQRFYALLTGSAAPTPPVVPTVPTT